MATLDTATVIDLTGSPDSSAVATSKRPKIDRQRAKQHEQELKSNNTATSPTTKRKREEEDYSKLSQVALEAVLLEATGEPVNADDSEQLSNSGLPASSKGTILKKKKRKKNKNKSADQTDDDNNPEPKEPRLFFEDDQPDLDPSTIHHEPSPPSTKRRSKRSGASNGLLLPHHVVLASETWGETSSEDGDSDHENGNASEVSDIEYDDGRWKLKNFRYWNDWANDPNSRFVITCEICGDLGHKRYDCTRTVCMKCGVKDDHQTRNCPLTITCFNCGAIGHMRDDCTQRRQAREDCFRCGSGAHFAINCPTLWRIYQYNTKSERHRILDKREASKHKSIHDEGGELYIGNRIWCYYCGHERHWGDDCPRRTRAYFRADPSIFSEAVARASPFANSSRHIVDQLYSEAPRLERPWDKQNNVLMNIGKMEREARQRKQREQAARDNIEGEEDWFANRMSGSKSDGRNRSNSGRGSGSGSRSELLDSRRGSSKGQESRSRYRSRDEDRQLKRHSSRK
ncbi:hypothetical protein FRC02_001843 [Tulasnella sp. 418]|nr:hypothetical protein FRC02_001843 [Tulasnella sp. 418]